MSLVRPVSVALAALALASALAPAVTAAAQFGYVVTTDTAYPNDNAYLENASYSVSFANGGMVSGGRFVPLNATQVDAWEEGFSDSAWGDIQSHYADVRTYTYFSILHSFDGGGNELAPTIVLAVPPGSAAGQTITGYLADFFTQYPSYDVPAVTQALIDGPDYPTPGGNQTFSDFFNYVTDPTHGLGMAIATDFQAGQTFDLVYFDPGNNFLATPLGTIAASAAPVPEPAAALGLPAAAALALGRRRRYLTA